MKRITITIAIGLALGITLAPPARAQAPAIQERVAALKQNLAQSEASLRQYQWVETTVVSLRSEEKSRTQSLCYYGADGVLQKVPVSATPQERERRGIRGRIAEKKKEELTDYMKQAIALVKQYVPPTPDKIQAVRDMGKVSITPNQPGNAVRLDLRDYLKPGDTLTINVDPATNRILGVQVATYIESPQDAVSLKVNFSTLNDGTTYPASATLVAQGKNLEVDVQNTGYRKPGN